MARAERPRGACPVCAKDCAITDEGGVRHHFPADPELTEPDSRRCRGVGQPPAEPRGKVGFVCRVPAGPTGCGHVVQLTANHRARSHLDQQGNPCPGGSDHPIAVDSRGPRADTAEWTEADWDTALEPENGAEESASAPVTPVSGDFDPQDPEGPGQAPAEVWHREDTNTTAYSDGSVWQGRRPADLPHDRPETEAEKTHRLTLAVREVLARRSWEEKLDTARRMDGVASAALGLPRDPDLCEHDEATCPQCQDDPDYCPSSAYNTGEWDPQAGEIRRIKALPVDERGPAVDELFAVVHRYTDESGTEWVHPGEPEDCSLPDCCKHPQGFDWADDQNGHSGSFCGLCEAEESLAAEAPGWKTPADELELMPEGIRRTAESNPECWQCGHEVTPVADQFDLYGKPKVIVWNCWDTCYHNNGTAGTHYGAWCRPQLPHEDRLGNLAAGACFRRHTAKHPLDRLVYRLQDTGDETRTATVVTPGPYAGRTGHLTELMEEITCTNQEGTPVPRPGLDTSATSPSKPQPNPLPPRTPSPSPTVAPTPTSTPTTPATARPTTASKAGSSTPGISSGPSAPASSPTPRARKQTPVADAFTTAKQAAKESDKYDNYGRYKLLHPKTGKPVKWTRVTTAAKSISDTYNLSMWAQRMVLKGASLRPDIVAAVGSLDVKQDRDRINGLVEEAKKAAGDKVAANLGTAVHAATEERDKALVGLPFKDDPVPERLLPTVDAYAAMLQEFGLEPVPGLIEFTTAVIQYEWAGTSDRCYRVTRDITFKLKGRMVTLYAGEYVIGDVKSGATLDYGWMEICVQLAIYAQGLNANGVWDWNTGTWGTPVMPDNPDVQIKVRTDVALVPHLPVDREEGTPLATLYAIDLDFGWATAVLCGQVRSARKEGNIATPLSVADVSDVAGVEPGVRAQSVVVHPATLEDKARAVTTQAAASAVWKEAVAARTPKAEVDRLTAIMRAKLEGIVETGG